MKIAGFQRPKDLMKMLKPYTQEQENKEIILNTTNQTIYTTYRDTFYIVKNPLALLIVFQGYYF